MSVTSEGPLERKPPAEPRGGKGGIILPSEDLGCRDQKKMGSNVELSRNYEASRDSLQAGNQTHILSLQGRDSAAELDEKHQKRLPSTTVLMSTLGYVIMTCSLIG